jgi:hypothetical protein
MRIAVLLSSLKMEAVRFSETQIIYDLRLHIAERNILPSTSTLYLGLESREYCHRDSSR